MVDTVGQMLKLTREAAGLSLSQLAARTHYGKTELSYVERGQRRASIDVIRACDKALGTTPLLTMLASLDHQGDDMKRRALLTTAAAVIGTAGVGGAAALTEIIRHGLLDATEVPEDWDAVVADHARRFVIDPSDQFGQSLTTHLMMLRQQVAERGATVERLRAIAQMSQLHGLWLGNRGNVPSARGWQRTAVAVADKSGDKATRVYVRGRALSRGSYEGDTVAQTLDGVAETIAIDETPSIGLLEAHSAVVHISALTGNLPQGRKAIAAMEAIVERLPDADLDHVVGPIGRTASFRNYLECRIGTLADAEAAWQRAAPVLRPVPGWYLEGQIYYARAHVVAGDIDVGVRVALSAVKALPSDHPRVIAMGVRDLVATIPATYCSDDVAELSTYAAAGPGPWETLFA